MKKYSVSNKKRNLHLLFSLSVSEGTVTKEKLSKTPGSVSFLIVHACLRVAILLVSFPPSGQGSSRRATAQRETPNNAFHP